MELNKLTAVSAIDGRYRSQTEHLDNYFSEYALIKYRILVEVEYLFLLSRKGICKIQSPIKKKLVNLKDNFTVLQAMEVKEIEKITNHDVKAIEYFIKKNLDEWGAGEIKEWVHFGLTSQDINNTAIPIAWKKALESEYLPTIINLNNSLKRLAKKWQHIPMLAKTHGQPASPTQLGKELMVFVERIDNQILLLSQIPISGKFGGATGNFNAHYVSFPDMDWIRISDKFLEDNLGIQRLQFTTQIEHYDNLAAGFDSIKRINTILIDFCRDIWTYISMDYFKQKIKAGEIGSSAMPHKVNPIDFENAEGNLGYANSILEHLTSKLPVSRLQRDLTDSTVLRNIGTPFAHTILSIKSIEKGLGKLVLNEDKIHEDLESNWVTISEAIQTILRRENYLNPYEALKDLTRGNQKIGKLEIHRFIDQLNISTSLKKELKRISPHNYVGKNPDY